jgi:GGDEF domain-containing protein
MNSASLLDDIRDPIEAVRVAERMQAELAIPFVVNQQEIVISASIGIAASTSPHTHAEDLLRDADITMYRAKRAGKACCEVSDTAMHENAVKRLQLETDALGELVENVKGRDRLVVMNNPDGTSFAPSVKLLIVTGITG